MDTSASEGSELRPPLGHWHCSCLHVLIAVVGVAAIWELAVWGRWSDSDAVVYLLLAVVAATFSRVARQTIFGTCTILGSAWFALILGDMLFGVYGPYSIDPRSFWIVGGFLAISAAALRFFGRMGRASLVASLMLAEGTVALVIVYTYGCPTLFQAFNDENRAYVIHHLRVWFPAVQQWMIVLPWLAGSFLGDLFLRQKEPGVDSEANHR